MYEKEYKEEHIDFLRELAKMKNITSKEITRAFNEQFNQSRSFSSIAYIRGQHGIVLNSNRSRASVGKNRRGSKPLGTERVRKGYVEVKTKQPNVWNQKQRDVWEKHHNKKLKHNEIVLFLDKNTRNFDIDNLYMINRKHLGMLNNYDLISPDRRITEAGINLVKLIQKRYKAERSK